MNVIPAKAGIHTEVPKSRPLKHQGRFRHIEFCRSAWVPAFAGTTEGMGRGKTMVKWQERIT